jgi:transposase
MFEKNLALQKISLEKDDMLVVYTDGITEAMDPDKNQFGENRLIQVVKENAHMTPAEFVEKLSEAINAFTRGAEQSDDITVVAIKEKMRAETAVFKFRKKLIDLVERKGMSVTEACRTMNVSTKAYYKYKKLFDEKGKAGLKPPKPKKRAAIRELSNPQKEAVLAVVRKHPEYGPKRIAEAVRAATDPPMKLDQGVVYEFLKRRRMGDAEGRKSFALNEVDTP